MVGFSNIFLKRKQKLVCSQKMFYVTLVVLYVAVKRGLKIMS